MYWKWLTASGLQLQLSGYKIGSLTEIEVSNALVASLIYQPRRTFKLG